jgi:hypothetical protein
MKRWLLSGLSLSLLLAWSPLAHGNGAPGGRPPGGPGIGPGVGPGGPPGGPGVGPGGVPPGGGFGVLGGPGMGAPGPAPVKAKFSLEVDEKAKEARLVVPVGVLLQGFGFPGGIGIPPGGAGIGGGFGGVPPGGAPPGFTPPGGGVPPGNIPPGGQPNPQRPGKLPGGVGQLHLPTIVAGLALTVALASGGFWLVRRGSGSTLAGLLVMATLALGATALWADIGPGPRPRPPVRPQFKETKGTPVTLPADVQITSNKITVEVSPVGDTVRLIVPKDAVKKGGEASEKKEEKKPVRDE